MIESLKPIKEGIKRLVFTKELNKTEKISYLKVLILLSFGLCTLFTFLQFSIVDSTDIVTLEPLTELETERFALKTNNYGFLAHILSFFIFNMFFFYIIGGDKPIKGQLSQIKERILMNKITKIFGVLITSILILFSLSLLIGRFTFDETGSLISLFTYRIGIVILYLWLLIQPALILSGSFLFINILAYDYPDIFSTSRRNWLFLLTQIICTLGIFILIYTLFSVTLESRPNPLDVTPFIIITETIGIFRINFYWVLVNIILILITVIVLFVMLFIIEKMNLFNTKRFDLRALVVFIMFSFIMIIIVVLLALPTNIGFSRIIIPIDLVIIFFISFFLFLLIAINKKWITKSYLNDRKGLLPWLIFFSLLFIFLKTIPTSLIFYSLRLKSLRNLFDLLGLIIVLITSIFRVVIIPESREFPEIKKGVFSIDWLSKIPPYAKVLFLFYISYNAFYISLESYSLAVLMKSTDYMAILKLEFLTISMFLGAFYAFWNFKPYRKDLSKPGLFKTLEGKIRKGFDKNQSISRFDK